MPLSADFIAPSNAPTPVGLTGPEDFVPYFLTCYLINANSNALTSFLAMPV